MIEEPVPSQAVAVLPQAVAVVIVEPVLTGQPPPPSQAVAALPPPRRVGGRQPVADHTGKPCGCGCGKVLEHHYYKTCFTCVDKDPTIAYNKIRLPCYGSGKHCITCTVVESIMII